MYKDRGVSARSFVVDVYKKGSTLISNTEHGLTSEKFSNTEGCRMPKEPITISDDDSCEDAEVGRASFSACATVSSAEPVFSGCAVEGRGR